MLRGLVRLWLPLMLGLLNRKGMERLLGRLQWALRPSAGLSPFPAGAYCWKHAGLSRVPRALLCPLLAAICFGFVPQRYRVKARVQAEPLTCWGACVLFARGFLCWFVPAVRGHAYVLVPPLGDYLASSGVMGLGARSAPSDLYEMAPGLCWQ